MAPPLPLLLLRSFMRNLYIVSCIVRWFGCSISERSKKRFSVILFFVHEQYKYLVNRIREKKTKKNPDKLDGSMRRIYRLCLTYYHISLFKSEKIGGDEFADEQLESHRVPLEILEVFADTGFHIC